MYDKLLFHYLLHNKGYYCVLILFRDINNTFFYFMYMEYISIHHNHLNTLEKLAIKTLPNESCAILLGKKSNTNSIVNNILPMNNSSQPIPSAKNKLFILINPVIWIIYSTSSHTFKAFISDKQNEITEINILLIKD